IYNCIGEKLTVEIWHQNSSTPDTIIQEIRKLLGIPESASFPYKFPNLDFTLDIQANSLGTLGEKLELDSNISNIRQRRREAINHRCQQVEQKVPLTSDITVAFIELDGADGFENRSEDPKKALRKGFALRKRWTQFISTDTKKLSHRAKNGFLDLLRQLGIQAQPPKIEVTKIEDKKLKDNELQPEKINYVAIWMIRQYSSTSSDGSKIEVPVMAYMTSDSTEIKAIVPGLEWLPYREVLLRIAQGEIPGYQNPQEAVVKFIKPKLKEVLSLGDTLLLCHAQNFRNAWKWLTNSNITQDEIKFGGEKSIAIQDFNSNLRMIRIRDYQSHETPEWYAQNGDETGFGKGVFRMGERVFASTYNTPKTFKLNRDLSKASPWVNKNNVINSPSPDAYYWNPGLVELIAACIQPNDNLLIWTIITHELRHLALHHDEPLKLPLPLHLAKLIEEYVLWLSDDLPSEND
ncbi:MAG: RNaseH domain-containing protein, partial [Rivularia sp. (in: cyanobacteria)]